MYNRSKLSDQSNFFLSSLIQSSKSRSRPVSITLGIQLASIAQLSQVDAANTGTFFIQNVKPGITTNIGKINELVPLDIDAVMEYASKFYRYRQEQVNGVSLPILGFKEDAKLEDFFGITKFFSADEVEVINKEAKEMTNYWVRFQNILRELG